MLTTLVTPIANLMHRLSFRHKFILAGGLMALAMAVALMPGLWQMLDDHRDISRRNRGISLILETTQVMVRVAEHRQAQLLALRNLEASGAANLPALSSDIETRLASLDRQAGVESEVVRALADAKALWSEIGSRSAGRYNPVKATADHGAMLFALRQYLDATATAPGMARDTDGTAIFLAGLLARDLPGLILGISDASSYGILTISGGINAEDRQRLGYLASHLPIVVDGIVAGQQRRMGSGAVAGTTENLSVTVPALANLLLNNGVLHPEMGITPEGLAHARLAASQATSALTEAAAAALHAGLAQREQEMEGLFATQLTAVAIILGIAIYVFYGFWHASRETIDTLVTATEQIIQGNLGAQAQVRSRDELEKIADRFNRLAQTLRDIIGHIADHSEQVGRMASQLHSSAAAVIQNSEVQTVAATSTSASVQQIAVGIAAVKDTAVDLDRLAGHSLTQVQGGETALENLEKRMNDAQGIMKRIAEVSGQFVADSQKVAKMTQRVKEISDQTNLLALNAAIEAARAGEAGRGFSVVADEVRKLAESVATTAREIDGVMQSMGRKSAEVTATIATGTANFSEAAKGLSIVAHSLGATAAAVRKTHSGVSDINRTIAEQKSASEDIARHVDGIASMAESTHHAVGDVYGLIGELGELTRRMNGHVAHFQT